MERPLILYDDDCGFCNWMVQWLLMWDRRRRLATLPIQAPEADPLLGHLSQEERMASWHFARPGEPLLSGGTAFPPLLRMLPGGGPPAAALERFPKAIDRAYRWVADNRSTLSKPIRAKWKETAARRVRDRWEVPSRS